MKRCTTIIGSREGPSHVVAERDNRARIFVDVAELSHHKFPWMLQNYHIVSRPAVLDGSIGEPMANSRSPYPSRRSRQALGAWMGGGGRATRNLDIDRRLSRRVRDDSSCIA